MEYWQRNSDGEIFDNEEDAYIDSIEREDVDTLEDYLLKAVDFDISKLFYWAIQQDGFWEAFQDEITEAREMIFEDDYSHWEDPDPDENAPPVEYRSGISMADPKQHFAVDPWGDLYEVNPTE